MATPKHQQPDQQRQLPAKRSPAVRVLRVVGLLGAMLVLLSLVLTMVLLVVGRVAGLDLSDDSDEVADYPQRVSVFDSTIDVARDGTVTVTERLSYHHGPGADGAAYRVIPAAGDVDGYGSADFGLHDVEVLDSDGIEPVTVQRSQDGSEATVRIGSGRLRGDHTFVLRYSYDTALVQGEHGPRLFFDVVGSDWAIPVAATRVSIHGPSGPLEARCYTGEPGNYLRCGHRRTAAATVRLSDEATLPGDCVTVDVDLAGLDPDVSLHRGTDEGHPSWWDRVSDGAAGLGLFSGFAVLFGYLTGRCFFALLGRPWPFAGGSGGGFAGGAGGGGGGGGAGGGGGG